MINTLAAPSPLPYANVPISTRVNKPENDDPSIVDLMAGTEKVMEIIEPRSTVAIPASGGGSEDR